MLPACGAVFGGLCVLLGQVALAADDAQLVLVGGGQVDGTGRDGRAQVPGVGDVQVSVGVGPAKHTHTHRREETLSTRELVCLCLEPQTHRAAGRPSANVGPSVSLCGPSY